MNRHHECYYYKTFLKKIGANKLLTYIPFEAGGCTFITRRTDGEKTYVILLWIYPKQPRHMDAMCAGLEQPGQ